MRERTFKEIETNSDILILNFFYRIASSIDYQESIHVN